MKKHLALFFVILLIVLTCLPGCSSEQQLYEFGLELTTTMSEMIESDAFAELYKSIDFSDILDEVNTTDYDSPDAVYVITTPETEELLETLGADAEWWNGLSDGMKEQVENRVTFQSYISIINGQAGTIKTAFSSVYFASKKIDNIKISKETVYLYTFKKGVPIVVTFQPNGGATGHFLFAEDLNTLSDVRELFEPLKCTVEDLDIK